ncbi:MAG: hypothetical protein DI562_06760 [Stenotrophomonas acidaminiphila]|nr:MAG: hypothetical protein DI562_06760 [Stenotrophomonas acidaminiphila]
MDNENLQLGGMLIDPKESMEVEIKGWLDLSSKEHCGTLAKAAIALANHGGGSLILGFEEDKATARFLPASDRPSDLRMYGQDAVSAVIAKHAEPNFHCDVHIVKRPADGDDYPIIRVPPSVVPIRSKVDSAAGSIRANVYYVRRPGPKSEQPGSGQEWDTLIRRCVAASRTEMLDAIRSILTGSMMAGAEPTQTDSLDTWELASRAAWHARVDSLPEDASARFPLGRYFCAYEIVDAAQAPPGQQYIDLLSSAPAKTGWRPFLVLHTGASRPTSVDGCVEMWLGSLGSDAAHSDYWRASKHGQFFLIRGLQEDTVGFPNSPAPGTVFDLTLPVWRVAECLIHAGYMVERLGNEGSKIRFRFGWEGLAGRQLVAERRWVDERHSHQDKFTTTTTTDGDEIANNLPEIVSRIVSPLFELFEFLEIPKSLPAEEVAKLLGGRM